MRGEGLAEEARFEPLDARVAAADPDPVPGAGMGVLGAVAQAFKTRLAGLA